MAQLESGQSLVATFPQLGPATSTAHSPVNNAPLEALARLVGSLKLPLIQSCTLLDMPNDLLGVTASQTELPRYNQPRNIRAACKYRRRTQFRTIKAR